MSQLPFRRILGEPSFKGRQRSYNSSNRGLTIKNSAELLQPHERPRGSAVTLWVARSFTSSGASVQQHLAYVQIAEDWLVHNFEMNKDLHW